MLQVCITMAPLTPFLTETMYQNLRRCLPESEAPPSVHFLDVPPAEEPHEGDAQIEASVQRMQTVRFKCSAEQFVLRAFVSVPSRMAVDSRMSSPSP